MSTGLGTILIFGTLLGSVFIAPKLKMNVGILAMLCAFIIGIWGCKLTITNMWANFPTMIVMTFILAMFFFGYIKRANIFNKISKSLVYIFRKRPALLPYAIAMTCTVLGACGCDATSNMAIMGPIAYSLIAQLGMPSILAGVVIWAAVATGGFPWVSTTALSRQIIGDYIGVEFIERGLWYIWAVAFVLNYLYITIIYIGSKAYTIKPTSLNIEKPEPFTAEEKKVLRVLIGFIFFAAVPPITNMIFPNTISAWFVTNANIYVLFVIGIIILNAMKIEKAATVIKEDISWDLILLLTGTTMLIKLLPEVGAIDMISGWLSTSIPSFLIVPMLYLSGAILTLFTNGMVAAQTLAPIFVTLVSQFPGLSMLGSYAALWGGTSGPTISPFSTGGALTLMSCPEEYKEKQTRQQIYMAGFVMVVGFSLALSGFYSLLRP